MPIFLEYRKQAWKMFTNEKNRRWQMCHDPFKRQCRNIFVSDFFSLEQRLLTLIYMSKMDFKSFRKLVDSFVYILTSSVYLVY